LRGIVSQLESEGYEGQFGAREGGRIRCFACRSDMAPDEASVEQIRRMEGASDPADMVAVLPVTCPRCGTRGTLVLGYGPEASLEDSEVLAALPDAAGPPRV
jgi:hypothetical protein